MSKFLTLSLVALMFVLPPPVSAATETSAGIKPGQFLYFFDTTFEKVGLFFTFGSENKAKKALEYADERLAEAKESANENNPKAVEKAMAGYKEEISLATEKSKGLKDQNKAEELLNIVSENTARHQEILASVLEKVPEEAKQAIRSAIEVSKKGQEEAVKQITELKGEIEKLKKEVAELKAKNTSAPTKSSAPSVSETTKPVTPPQSQTPTKTEEIKIVTLPNGAVVEMGANGNVVRTIKEALQRNYTSPIPTTTTQPSPTSPVPVQIPTPTPIQTPVPIPTPTLTCTEDTWNCSNWSTCSSSGSQIRTCSKTFDCSVVNTQSPNTTQSCTPPTPVQTPEPVPVVIPTTPPPAPTISYSDYNFNYQWSQNGSGTLSCPMTPRDIRIKKAVFEIPDSELQKINILRIFESDGLTLKIQTLPPRFAAVSGVDAFGRSSSYSYSLEETRPNTFVYFGGTIPLCGNGGTVHIGNMVGSLMDTPQVGRNVKVYLTQKGITIDVNSIANGVEFELHVLPVMSEWEIWDYTTNKPVKIN